MLKVINNALKTWEKLGTIVDIFVGHHQLKQTQLEPSWIVLWEMFVPTSVQKIEGVIHLAVVPNIPDITFAKHPFRISRYQQLQKQLFDTYRLISWIVWGKPEGTQQAGWILGVYCIEAKVINQPDLPTNFMGHPIYSYVGWYSNWSSSYVSKRIIDPSLQGTLYMGSGVSEENNCSTAILSAVLTDTENNFLLTCAHTFESINDPQKIILVTNDYHKFTVAGVYKYGILGNSRFYLNNEWIDVGLDASITQMTEPFKYIPCPPFPESVDEENVYMGNVYEVDFPFSQGNDNDNKIMKSGFGGMVSSGVVISSNSLAFRTFVKYPLYTSFVKAKPLPKVLYHQIFLRGVKDGARKFSTQGDAGSLIVGSNGKALGLLIGEFFGGNEIYYCACSVKYSLEYFSKLMGSSLTLSDSSK